MDLRQLRTIIHVAELGSVSKAADRLHVAQPALSRQIRLLEQELDVTLFQRHGRGMRPTERAIDIVEHAQRIMAELDGIRAIAADHHLPLRGHVAIGMPPTVTDVLTAPLAKKFRSENPEATLRIVNAYSRHLLDWLQRGELDVAILFDGPPLPSILTTPLVDETLFLVGPGDAGLDPTRPIPFDDLADIELVLPSVGHGLRDLLDNLANQRRIPLTTSIEADSYVAIKTLVNANEGMTILPPASVRAELASGSLTHAPLDDPAPRRRLVLSLPRERPASPLVRFVATAVETTVVSLVGNGAWPGTVLVKGDFSR